MRIAHFTIDLSLGYQRRDRVDDDQIDAARANQGIGDLQTLLAAIRLGDQQLIELDASLAA